MKIHEPIILKKNILIKFSLHVNLSIVSVMSKYQNYVMMRFILVVIKLDC